MPFNAMNYLGIKNYNTKEMRCTLKNIKNRQGSQFIINILLYKKNSVPVYYGTHIWNLE